MPEESLVGKLVAALKAGRMEEAEALCWEEMGLQEWEEQAEQVEELRQAVKRLVLLARRSRRRGANRVKGFASMVSATRLEVEGVIAARDKAQARRLEEKLMTMADELAGFKESTEAAISRAQTADLDGLEAELKLRDGRRFERLRIQWLGAMWEERTPRRWGWPLDDEWVVEDLNEVSGRRRWLLLRGEDDLAALSLGQAFVDLALRRLRRHLRQWYEATARELLRKEEAEAAAARWKARRRRGQKGRQQQDDSKCKQDEEAMAEAEAAAEAAARELLQGEEEETAAAAGKKKARRKKKQHKGRKEEKGEQDEEGGKVTSILSRDMLPRQDEAVAETEGVGHEEADAPSSPPQQLEPAEGEEERRASEGCPDRAIQEGPGAELAGRDRQEEEPPLPEQEQQPREEGEKKQQQQRQQHEEEGGAQEEEEEGEGALVSVPREHLTCPISMVLMTDPVFADDGSTYQRHAIQDWFDKCTAVGKPATSPLTGLPLRSTELRPNHLARSLVRDWMRRTTTEGPR